MQGMTRNCKTNLSKFAENAGQEIARHKIAGHKNAKHKIARHASNVLGK